jgi:hypothetical protein
MKCVGPGDKLAELFTTPDPLLKQEGELLAELAVGGRKTQHQGQIFKVATLPTATKPPSCFRRGLGVVKSSTNLFTSSRNKRQALFFPA